MWQRTVQAIKEGNHEAATDEKTKIEDMQREEAAKRIEEGTEWGPRYFKAVHDESEKDLDWILDADM